MTPLGVTASEFASGSVIMDVRAAKSLIIRPVSSPEEVDEFAMRATGVFGSLDAGSESFPVNFTYEAEGDILTTGIVSATIKVSLVGVESVQNTTLLEAFGAPLDGRFLSAIFYVNYLSQTITGESRVQQPASLDPDGLGGGIIITGVLQPQTSTLNNIQFFFREITE